MRTRVRVEIGEPLISTNVRAAIADLQDMRKRLRGQSVPTHAEARAMRREATEALRVQRRAEERARVEREAELAARMAWEHVYGGGLPFTVMQHTRRSIEHDLQCDGRKFGIRGR